MEEFLKNNTINMSPLLYENQLLCMPLFNRKTLPISSTSVQIPCYPDITSSSLLFPRHTPVDFVS